MTRLPTEYAQTSNEDLELIFGQHVAKNICDLEMIGGETNCSLHGQIDNHWAPDDSTRPHPIAFDDQFVKALIATRASLGRAFHLQYGVNIRDTRGYVDATFGFSDGRTFRTHSARTEFLAELPTLLRRTVIIAILCFTDAPLLPVVRKGTPTTGDFVV